MMTTWNCVDARGGECTLLPVSRRHEVEEVGVDPTF